MTLDQSSPAPPSYQSSSIEMVGITKRFPGGVLANEDISLSAAGGSIHAIVGENGAGKSTLMNILYGRYQPDEGEMRVGGAPVRINSPAAAIRLGIGMVTQHTTLIPALTLLDNIILGAEPTAAGIIDRRAAQARISELAGRLGVQIDLSSLAGALSVASLQKAEIVKALYRGARTLILDEPTATLAPPEAEALFALLKRLTDEGATILFITHKLREVMEHSESVTVLRGGKSVGRRRTSETNAAELLALMIGRGAEITPNSVAATPARSAKGQPALDIRNLGVKNDRGIEAVRGVNLSVAAGEIVGIAGVDGSGQKELAEAIVGLRPAAGGSLMLSDEDVTRLPIARRLKRGIHYIPEDRHREGLILDFTLSENLLLGRQRDSRFGGGRILSLRRIKERGQELVTAHGVRPPNGQTLGRALSGGNQQKVVIARALEGSPKLLVAMQPTRGLDVEAARLVYERFRAALNEGAAILLFSLDLDEILEMSDRVAVMYNGRLQGIVSRNEATADSVGALMVGGTA